MTPHMTLKFWELS
uniref:Uncharacterized protein n=1 Tax=Arundo donax TaxID=35708 RepID=A0A0A9EN31_ARUDO